MLPLRLYAINTSNRNGLAINNFDWEDGPIELLDKFEGVYLLKFKVQALVYKSA